MNRLFSPLDVLAMVALLLTCLDLAISVPQERGESYYDKGRADLFDGNYQTALYNFQQAINLEQDQPIFYAAHAQASANEALGMEMPASSWVSLPQPTEENQALLVSSLNNYRTALRFAPNDSALWTNLAWIEAFLHKDPGALDAFRKAVFLDPNDAISRMGLGLLYERLGFFNNALEEYAHAVAVYPRIVDSTFFSELKGRNRSASESVVARAVSLITETTESPITLASIAKLHAYQGQLDVARSEYAQALHELPNLSYTWTNLGMLELSQGKIEAATNDLQHALFLDRTNTIAANELASIEFANDNLEGSKRLYAQTLLTPLHSVHADRTWRIYHVPPINADDAIPAGLLAYISPNREPISLCGDWLDRLYNIAGLSLKARGAIEQQQKFCARP